MQSDIAGLKTNLNWYLIPISSLHCPPLSCIGLTFIKGRGIMCQFKSVTGTQCPNKRRFSGRKCKCSRHPNGTKGAKNEGGGADTIEAEEK